AASGTATVGWRAITARSAGSSARSGASAASGGVGGVTGREENRVQRRTRGSPSYASVGPLIHCVSSAAYRAPRRSEPGRASIHAVHGRVDAVGDDRLARVGGLLEHDVDLGALTLRELLEHVVGAVFLRHRLAHPDADASESIAVQVRRDRPQPVVTREPA